MDTASLLERYSPVFRKYWAPILLCLAGLIFLGYGLIASFAGHQSEPGFVDDKGEILFEAASTSKEDETDAAIVDSKEKMIVVDIGGAVDKPGVYTFESDARVQDVLIRAGGLAEDADRGQVAKGLNLASKLVDGSKIYIPFQGEALVAQGSGGDSGGVILGAEAEGQININTASESELDSLPGIGEVTTEKIISNRPYSAIEELVDKKIVGKKVFEDIKGKIRVD